MRPGHDDGPALAAMPGALLAECYTDMRRIARGLMARDGMARFIQPTDLVNEAAIRLLRSNLSDVSDQGHMLAFAARAMRRVLIDEARKTMAGKRQPITVMTLLPDDPDKLIDLEALDRALAEAVAATGLSQRTVTRRWQAARLWLLERLADDPAA